MDSISDFDSILIAPENRGFLMCRIHKDYIAGYNNSFMETEIRAHGNCDVFFVDVFCLSLLCTFCAVYSAEVVLCQPICSN